MGAGEFVPDSITNRMVRDRLGRPDAEGGFLLDGYPRTTAQIDFLDGALAECGNGLDLVLKLTAVDQELVARLLGRSKESGRSDDTASVIRHRLNLYQKQTAEVVAGYDERGILNRVNGLGQDRRGHRASAEGRLRKKQHILHPHPRRLLGLRSGPQARPLDKLFRPGPEGFQSNIVELRGQPDGWQIYRQHGYQLAVLTHWNANAGESIFEFIDHRRMLLLPYLLDSAQEPILCDGRLFRVLAESHLVDVAPSFGVWELGKQLAHKPRGRRIYSLSCPWVADTHQFWSLNFICHPGSSWACWHCQHRRFTDLFSDEFKNLSTSSLQCNQRRNRVRQPHDSRPKHPAPVSTRSRDSSSVE